MRDLIWMAALVAVAFLGGMGVVHVIVREQEGWDRVRAERARECQRFPDGSPYLPPHCKGTTHE